MMRSFAALSIAAFSLLAGPGYAGDGGVLQPGEGPVQSPAQPGQGAGSCPSTPQPYWYCICERLPGAVPAPPGGFGGNPYALENYQFAIVRIRFEPQPLGPGYGQFGWSQIKERLTSYEWLEEGCAAHVMTMPACLMPPPPPPPPPPLPQSGYN